MALVDAASYIVAFLIGSIPTGYLVCRSQSISIADHGSRNIGATNVARIAGLKSGLVTFVLDVTKGFAALGLGPTAVPLGALAVLGHCFSPFLKFRGGKGVATAFGVYLGIDLIAAVAGFTAFTITALLSKRASAASLTGVVFATLCYWNNNQWNTMLTANWIMFSVGLLIVIRHRENLRRLVSGDEQPFSVQQSER